MPIFVERAAKVHCLACNGFRMTRADDDDSRSPIVPCRACKGTGVTKFMPPFSVDWIRGEDGPSVECRMLVDNLDDQESATAQALHLARELGPFYAGGRVVISDSCGNRTAEFGMRPIRHTQRTKATVMS